jgi:hypothetical protein
MWNLYLKKDMNTKGGLCEEKSWEDRGGKESDGRMKMIEVHFRYV